MRKTISLLGLLMVGLMLLANPSTGILASPDTESAMVTSEPTTTVSGDPPPDNDGEEQTATTAEPTSTTVTPTTATEPATTDSFSVVGSVEDSEFGTFQAEVFFTDGAIVAVEALQLPTDRKSTSINNSAVPIYEDAVIAAQSVEIDVVSGATVTWDNYTASVQSALDEVGL